MCDMGSYRTRRQPSVIRAHITHFFTYHTSPRVIYSLYHNNCPICLLFVEVLPNMSIKPWKIHEIKTWKIMKYFCSVISYFPQTYHTLHTVWFGQLEWYNDCIYTSVSNRQTDKRMDNTNPRVTSRLKIHPNLDFQCQNQFYWAPWSCRVNDSKWYLKAYLVI